jgi:hypothetical protein
MHRYWITFDCPVDHKRSLGIDRGVGVTARDLDDALLILRERIWRGSGLARIDSVTEDVDVSTLDSTHVIPNMAPPLARGIWFPLGYNL